MARPRRQPLARVVRPHSAAEVQPARIRRQRRPRRRIVARAELNHMPAREPIRRIPRRKRRR